jgi:hypothetical protein
MKEINKIKLSINERLLLINQFTILKNIENDDITGLMNKSYYDRNIKILENGYELEYFSIYNDIEEPLSYEGCNFVYSVLNMYRDLYFSFENIKNNTKILDSDIKFKGFDANDIIEGAYISYAKYIIDDLKKYEEIKKYLGNSFNSHCPMTYKYNNMLRKYEKYKKEKNINFFHIDYLTEEEILDIINY